MKLKFVDKPRHERRKQRRDTCKPACSAQHKRNAWALQLQRSYRSTFGLAKPSAPLITGGMSGVRIKVQAGRPR